MCGIAGYCVKNNDLCSNKYLSDMLKIMKYRGPDDEGFYIHNNVALAHLRLSIIDINTGKQPMHSDDDNYIIIFNGEIFNYLELKENLEKEGVRFRSQSDTEVIIKYYEKHGKDCVQYFNGQWALVIYDKKNNKLFLSRDRMGIRPLFYNISSNGISFASEIKALFKLPWINKNINYFSLAEVFSFWHPLAPNSFFENILQLEPAHSMLIDLETFSYKIYRYWQIEYSNKELNYTEQELSEQLFELFKDATKIMLRSDVPVGAYLSGGLDSSITAAFIVKYFNKNLHTFSIEFEDKEFDESIYQKEVADFLGVNHSSMICTYEDIVKYFPEVIWHIEQPLVRTAPVPLYLLSKLVKDSGYKVVLTGEGADEVFGGYDIFKETKIRHFWGKEINSQIRPLLLKRLYPYMTQIQSQPIEYLKSFFHVKEELLLNPFFSHLPRFELGKKNTLFLSKNVQHYIRNYDHLWMMEKKLPESFHKLDYFSKAQYLETIFLLPSYILSAQSDRMTMANSIEGRFPFLDNRIVDFGAKIPIRLRMNGLNEKYLLKKTFTNILPRTILQRTKQPYRAPDARSFFQNYKNNDYIFDLLSEKKINANGLFDFQAVQNLIEKGKNNQIVSIKDNMAFIAILSTQILCEKFI